MAPVVARVTPSRAVSADRVGAWPAWISVSAVPGKVAVVDSTGLSAPPSASILGLCSY